jgi:hypothetical protein
LFLFLQLALLLQTLQVQDGATLRMVQGRGTHQNAKTKADQIEKGVHLQSKTPIVRTSGSDIDCKKLIEAM